MPNTCIYLFSFFSNFTKQSLSLVIFYHLTNKDYILTIRIYLYFYFCHEKFLWWGISLYFSISLQVTAFAQSNLSNISFNQPLKYRVDYRSTFWINWKNNLFKLVKKQLKFGKKETGKTLFYLHLQAELTINLVLDNQQATKNERKNSINKLLKQQEEWREK